jgi:hypothetical protein
LSPRKPGTPSGANPNAFALAVARLFFPQSQSLGIDATGQSPAVLRKITYAGANSSSFRQAADALRHLADLAIPIKQVERVTRRIGGERVAERDAEVAAYRQLPLPERKACPAGAMAPPVATVQMDGGRLQIFDRSAPEEEVADESTPPAAGHATATAAGDEPIPFASAAGTPAAKASDHASPSFWREDKVGLLVSMASPTHAVDPCPHIPDTFVNPLKILKLVRELKPVTGATEEAAEGAGLAAPDEASAHHDPPALWVRTVVATRAPVEEFAPMLATAAWRRGFYAADRRAFVADGLACNWTTWQAHFSSFVPVLDFIHALSYVFTAATTGRDLAAGWASYAEWIQWLWAGEVSRVIEAVAERVALLGEPTAEESESSERNRVRGALGYLRNHQDKMKYAEYRRQGLPITSSHIESTIKRMNQRVKGTEKFWSEAGAEELLQLRADYLSETEPMEKFWASRPDRATGQNRNRRAA